MSEQTITINFKGLNIVVGILVMLVVLGIRIRSINQSIVDPVLVQKVQLELLSEYLPGDVDSLRKAMASGNEDKVAAVATSVTSTRINIRSIKPSYSVFDFSIKKRDIVLKVAFSLEDANGTRTAGTRYYRSTHSPTFNGWDFLRKSSKWSYYLNFV